MKWYLTVVSRYISLVTINIKPLSCTYWVFVFPLWRALYPNPCPAPFSNGFCFHCCESSLYILDTRLLSDASIANIIPHSVNCCFTFLIISFDAHFLQSLNYIFPLVIFAFGVLYDTQSHV